MSQQLTAVVTGASGFVGSHLVDLLLEQGFRVRCVLRKSSSLQWLSGKPVEVTVCGLFDVPGLEKAFSDADYIFHVAGVVKSKSPEGYFKGNAQATENILTAALNTKRVFKKVLIVSSQTVSGPSLDGKPVTEDMLCHPITTYGRSKLEQEQVAASFMGKLPITICRAPAVYGQRDTEIFIFFQTFVRGLFTTIGFNTKKISLIHVTDLVHGLFLAAAAEHAAGKTYFISSEKYYTWDEIGEVTALVTGKRPIKVRVPHFLVYAIAAVAQFFAAFSSKAATLNLEKARDITRQYWICDTGKAVRELGYKQQLDLKEGITRTVQWYRAQGWM